MRSLLAHAVVPFFLVAMLLGARWLQQQGVPSLLVTPLVVGPFAALAAGLERLWPDRAAHRPFDQPLWIEVAHFLFSFEVGYGLALAACALLGRAVHAAVAQPLWPVGLGLWAQVALAVLLQEATSYWQHRLIHRVPGLFRFHALHHSGERLNLVRVTRFHAVDIATASFIAYVPLVVLSAPEDVVTLLAVLLSGLGMIQHANLRARTPAWLDWLMCTPAVHRHHHSRARPESDTNFGTTVMLFDVLFGTYGRPAPCGPAATGNERDPVPRGFWPQVAAPFAKGR